MMTFSKRKRIIRMIPRAVPPKTGTKSRYVKIGAACLLFSVALLTIGNSFYTQSTHRCLGVSNNVFQYTFKDVKGSCSVSIGDNNGVTVTPTAGGEEVVMKQVEMVEKPNLRTITVTGACKFKQQKTKFRRGAIWIKIGTASNKNEEKKLHNLFNSLEKLRKQQLDAKRKKQARSQGVPKPADRRASHANPNPPTRVEGQPAKQAPAVPARRSSRGEGAQRRGSAGCANPSSGSARATSRKEAPQMKSPGSLSKEQLVLLKDKIDIKIRTWQKGNSFPDLLRTIGNVTSDPDVVQKAKTLMQKWPERDLATERQVKNVYRSMSLFFHPDRIQNETDAKKMTFESIFTVLTAAQERYIKIVKPTMLQKWIQDPLFDRFESIVGSWQIDSTDKKLFLAAWKKYIQKGLEKCLRALDRKNVNAIKKLCITMEKKILRMELSITKERLVPLAAHISDFLNNVQKELVPSS